MIKQAPSDIGLHELLQMRWSIRSFDQRNLSFQDIEKLFQAAAWSSSSMNEQPWRFVYAERGKGHYDDILSVLMPGNALWACNAPLLIAVFAKKYFSDGTTNLHAWHDVGAACMSLLLQGVSLGIYGHQMGGFDREKAKLVFGNSDDYDIVSIMALGYPGEADALEEPFKTRETTPRVRRTPEFFAFTSFEQL
ncbi:MAG: nitroreductase family protein [Ignavibacteria bacterium]